VVEIDAAGRVVGCSATAARALGEVAPGLPLTELVRRAPTTRWLLEAAPDGRGAAARLTRIDEPIADGALLAAATTGIVARGITHDLNNLFTCILACATAPVSEAGDPARHLAAIEHAVLRGAELLGLLHDLAPGPAEARGDLGDVAAWCGLLLERVAAAAGVAVRVDVVDASVALAPHELQQVLINLGLNAIDAMSAASRGELVITARRVDDEVVLAVADTGPGIPPERLVALFEPGRSTKHGHAGVGLSVVHRLVRRAGGRVEVDSTVGGGTTFRIHLPTARSQP
jgi:two-component system NtrC family sensor kinase